MTLTVGSLFAGIGGFDLGFERAGMRTLWFCEQDPYCQAVLRKHWPDVPIFDDVRTLVADTQCGRRDRFPHSAAGHNGDWPTPQWQEGANRPPNDDARGLVPVPVPPVDVLCGGFPCQDLSSAGKQAGLAGDRSGLWFEFLRLIGELRPGYVVVENVPQLRKYLDVVAGGLAEIGYDAEWDVISAADFGAPHLRKRLWLVAYPSGGELREQPRRRRGPGWTDAPLPTVDGEARSLADADDSGRSERRRPGAIPAQFTAAERGSEDVANGSGWSSEPDVGRVAHGVPARVDRLRALGNALVPPIAEFIGRRIVAYEEAA